MATDRLLDHLKVTTLNSHYTKVGHLRNSGASSKDTESAVEHKHLWQVIPHKNTTQEFPNSISSQKLTPRRWAYNINRRVAGSLTLFLSSLTSLLEYNCFTLLC